MYVRHGIHQPSLSNYTENAPVTAKSLLKISLSMCTGLVKDLDSNPVPLRVTSAGIRYFLPCNPAILYLGFVAEDAPLTHLMDR